MHVLLQNSARVINCLNPDSNATAPLLTQVLHIFPTTIRRRILRHLYLGHFRNAYLFKGVRQKFIDALLGVARIELFMPQARLAHSGCAPCKKGVHQMLMRCWPHIRAHHAWHVQHCAMCKCKQSKGPMRLCQWWLSSGPGKRLSGHCQADTPDAGSQSLHTRL